MTTEQSANVDPQRVALFLPSLAVGGAERAMLNLAVGFSRRGWNTDLLLANAHSTPYLSELPDAVRVIDLHSSGVLRALFPLTAYLRRERPFGLLSALGHADLVAMLAARLAHVQTRTAITIHTNVGRAMQETTDMKDRLIPWLLGRFQTWADVIVAVSEGVAADLVSSTGIPRHRIEVVYNPVITHSIDSAARERPGHAWLEDGECPVVLGIGRLTPEKNFALLIEAFALLRCTRNARLLILGEGRERPALEALVRERGLQDIVAMPGFADNPFACMSHASVVALSSDREGLPMVLVESLAVGTPVVSTDCPSGPREILHGGKLGALVPVGDVEAFARALASALDSPRPAPSREALREFTVDAVVDRFETLLRAVCVT